MLSENTVRK